MKNAMELKIKGIKCDKCCLGCIDFNKCEQRFSRLETLLYISLEG